LWHFVDEGEATAINSEGLTDTVNNEGQANYEAK